MSMRKLCILVGFCVIPPALIMLFNFALTLLNMDGDLPAVGGYVILMCFGAAAVVLGLHFAPVLAKWLKLVPVVCVALVLSSCYTIVEPGRVGIKVKQTGGDRGVQDIPVESGRVFYNPLNESVLEYPTNVRRAIWTKSSTEGKNSNEEISFQSSDALHFDADVAVSYHLTKEKVPHFYVRFRSDDLDTFTHGFFRDAVRKSIGLASVKFTAEQINGGMQADLEKQAQISLVEAMSPYGVVVDQLAFTSPPRPPAAVKAAIEAKIAAIQSAERVENQRRESTAQGEKLVIAATAEARANALITSSITPTLVEWEKVRKWDGKLPQYQGGGGSMLFGVK